MIGARRFVRLSGGLLLAATLTNSVAAAQTDETTAWLHLGGYARSITGGSDLGYDVAGVDRRSAFNADVIRLKWRLEMRDVFLVSVHNRLQARFSSTSSGDGVLGFGVSVVPDRLVDLSTTIVDQEHVDIWHDLDRASLTVFLSAADVTVGRQAITWGISSLFPVADLWAQFSPFELDTEEKPGVDAVRALAYPAGNVELDFVIASGTVSSPADILPIDPAFAARETRRELSAGVRTTVELPVGDVYLAGGKFWRELIALGGVSLVADVWKFKAEAAVPWDLDAEQVRAVRFTGGVEWLGPDVLLSIEYHFNGLGSSQSDEYAALLASPEFARGETYYLGRHMAGGFGSYLATDRLTLSFGALTNLTDPSAALLPALNYDLGQSIRIGAGGLVSLGSKPVFPTGLLPRLESEFGTYGSFGYAQVAVYF
jgi:hypothetical protein